jgi:hypothetical protein
MLRFAIRVDLSGFNKLEEQLRKEQVRKLKKVGAFLRRTAMWSMRRRKGPSKPGTPPSVHEGGLKRLQRYVVDEQELSLYNGPILYKRGIAQVLEHGGTTTITAGQNKGQQMRVEPRPTMRLAQQTNLPAIAKIIGE